MLKVPAVRLTLLVLLLSAGVFSFPEKPPDGQTLVLISLDGLRWDHPELFQMKRLLALGAEGVRAESLLPVYPTETFPNHHSIVTGLYPEDHGLISNTMYDPDLDALFRIRDSAAVSDPRWWGGEPIWATAKRHGLISAAYFWPGTDVEIGGVRPDHWYPYDSSVGWRTRVDQLFEWLQQPQSRRPSLITQYFGQVDRAGHEFGPEAAETRQAAAQVDAILGHIQDRLREENLLDRVNLLIVSDHGMAEVPPQQVIFLDDYLDSSCCRIVGSGAAVHVFPPPGQEKRVQAALQGSHPHMDAYLKADIPSRLRYGRHRRIPPLLVTAQEGWFLRPQKRNHPPPRGFHGYDNRYASMQGVLAALGPSFARGVRVRPVQAVDLYNLMAAILGVPPAPNRGDPEEIRLLLSPALPLPRPARLSP